MQDDTKRSLVINYGAGLLMVALAASLGTGWWIVGTAIGGAILVLHGHWPGVFTIKRIGAGAGIFVASGALATGGWILGQHKIVDGPHKVDPLPRLATEQTVDREGVASPKPPAANKRQPAPAKRDERNPASLGSTPQTISAPNGIAIGGGTVTNPVVNNFSPPERHLTPQQIDALASIPPCDTPESVVAVVWEPDPEAVNYAGDFTAPLQSIHCLGYRAPLQSRPPLIHGITLVAADWSRANATAERLRDAMTKAGIAFTVETGNITMGEAATVVVGVR